MWESKIFIAQQDTNKSNTFFSPKEYKFNVSQLSGNREIVMYGERISKMQKAVVNKSKYIIKGIEKCIFNVGDLAYLNGNTPIGEVENGENANYTIVDVEIGARIITLYFEKII